MDVFIWEQHPELKKFAQSLGPEVINLSSDYYIQREIESRKVHYGSEDLNILGGGWDNDCVFRLVGWGLDLGFRNVTVNLHNVRHDIFDHDSNNLHQRVQPLNELRGHRNFKRLHVIPEFDANGQRLLYKNNGLAQGLFR